MQKFQNPIYNNKDVSWKVQNVFLNKINEPYNISTNNYCFFKDGKYSDKINSLISSGSKSKRPYLPFGYFLLDQAGSIVPNTKEEKGVYIRGLPAENFTQWVDRMLPTQEILII